MHKHNNNNTGRKGMWWMMVSCLFLLGFVFIGGAKPSSGGYLWLIIIGVFVVAHIWMMFKGHRGHNVTNKTHLPIATSTAQAGEGNDKHKHGGCCH